MMRKDLKLLLKRSNIVVSATLLHDQLLEHTLSIEIIQIK